MSLGETDDESVSAGTSPPGIKSPAILLSLYNLTNQRWILKKLFLPRSLAKIGYGRHKFSAKF